MKNYKNLELDIVLIENVDVITASPFTGVEDDFGDPNNFTQG
jgi:hypothetical protein